MLISEKIKPLAIALSEGISKVSQSVSQLVSYALSEGISKIGQSVHLVGRSVGRSVSWSISQSAENSVKLDRCL